MLGTHYHLTQFKIRDMLARMMGVDFSVGAISQAQGKLALALKAPVAQAAATLSSATVIHMDGTRFPREGSANLGRRRCNPRWRSSRSCPRVCATSYGTSSATARRRGGLHRYAAYADVEAGNVKFAGRT